MDSPSSRQAGLLPILARPDWKQNSPLPWHTKGNRPSDLCGAQTVAWSRGQGRETMLATCWGALRPASWTVSKSLMSFDHEQKPTKERKKRPRIVCAFSSPLLK
jgi:hypothetical protein